LYGAVAHHHDGRTSHSVPGRVEGGRGVNRIVVLVDELERTDMDRLIKLEDLGPTEVVLVRIIDEPIIVFVVDILRQEENITDVGLKVRVMRRRRIRIEDYDCVRVALVGPRGYVNAAIGVLLAGYRAGGKPFEVDGEAAFTTRKGEAT
jgi:hypothetical protein